MKKIFLVIVAMCLSCALLVACGDANSSGPTSASQQEEATEKKDNSKVESIDFTTENGTIKYIGFEAANPGLTDFENALVVKFEFTNLQDDAAQVQSAFHIEFFQNGVELNDSVSYSSEGGEQYDLVGAFFKDLLNGGTLTFGQIAVLEDNSPLTIKVTRNDGQGSEYQMMELDFAGGQSGETAAAEVSAEAIDAALQGTWSIAGADGSLTFDQGTAVLMGGGTTASGTYTINTENSIIDASLVATDGNVSVQIPYTFTNGVLTVFNNNGQALTKQ